MAYNKDKDDKDLTWISNYTDIVFAFCEQLRAMESLAQ